MKIDTLIHARWIIPVEPENTVIIEDSILGLRSAVASGSHVVALKGSVPPENLVIAHKIVDHLDEITMIFLEDLLLDPV